MNEWKVLTLNGDEAVAAHIASVATCGALVFTENSGAIKRAFAAGSWLSCQLVKAAPGGYR